MEALIHSQLSLNIPEQYHLMQQRLPRHLHQGNRMQMLETQQLPIVEGTTQLDMANQHLMSMVNSEEEHTNERDQSLDKDVSDTRQDFGSSSSPYDMNGSRPDTRWAESQVIVCLA